MLFFVFVFALYAEPRKGESKERERLVRECWNETSNGEREINEGVRKYCYLLMVLKPMRYSLSLSLLLLFCTIFNNNFLYWFCTFYLFDNDPFIFLISSTTDLYFFFILTTHFYFLHVFVLFSNLVNFSQNFIHFTLLEYITY